MVWIPELHEGTTRDKYAVVQRHFATDKNMILKKESNRYPGKTFRLCNVSAKGLAKASVVSFRHTKSGNEMQEKEEWKKASRLQTPSQNLRKCSTL